MFIDCSLLFLFVFVLLLLLLDYLLIFNKVFHFLLDSSACFRYSCDLRVVRLLRERTLGNSSTKLQKQILEQHSEVHIQKVLRFLQAREPFHIQAQRGMLSIKTPERPFPQMAPVPKAPWFLAVYVQDVMTRLDELNAKITSTFGSILKLDSTKKVYSIKYMNLTCHHYYAQKTTIIKYN